MLLVLQSELENVVARWNIREGEIGCIYQRQMKDFTRDDTVSVSVYICMNGLKCRYSYLGCSYQ